MRILYQHRTLADGAEGIHISEMVEAFEALGHTVTMHALTSSARRGEGKPSRWGRLKDALPRAVFELAAVAYNLVDYVSFRTALRDTTPGLVYKRHALYDAAVILACRHSGVPVVLEVNCPYSSDAHRAFEVVRFPRIARLLERVAFARATLVATVSSPLAQQVERISRGGARVVVVPNGANPSRFAPERPSPELRARLAPDGAVLAGWAGILRPWHRVDLLLEAVAPFEALHLAVIGDGPDRPRLEEVVRRLRLSRRVCFTGRVPHDEMPAYIATLDVAVAADDRTGYASPMKLLEYMAMGKAVVAPRLPNIQDFIDEGVDGALFAPGDAGDLGLTLSRLAHDVDLRERLGRNARLKVERERNWQAIARTILDTVETSVRESSEGARGRPAS